LNITVTHDREMRLLNYLTAPNVLVWSAVLASCAIPGMYDTVELFIKTDDSRCVPYHPASTRIRYIDGSVGGDLPMQRIAELFNVNTFIVSQVNPHVCPFVSVDTGQVLDTKIRKRFLKLAKSLVGNQIKHYMKQADLLGLLPSYMKQIANIVWQSYKGHVTVVPSPTFKDYCSLLDNVNEELYWPAFQAHYVHSLRSKFPIYVKIHLMLKGSKRPRNCPKEL
jgi:TAG lipase / steryl ester hydrolase / phospholipase A2 / LPA acyltransferase